MRARLAHILVLLLVLPGGAGCAFEGREGSLWTWGRNKKDAAGHGNVRAAPSPRISPETHLAAGAMLERQNDLPGAIRQYKKALEADPALMRAYNRLAVVHQKMNRFDDAEEYYRRGLAANPDSAMLHNNLGYCHLVQQEYVAAEQEFRHALALAPRFERARMNLAITLARTHRLGDSAIEFSRVVPAEEAYYNVAVICVEMRDYEWAAEALRQALAIDPQFSAARTQLEYVTTIVASDSKAPPTAEARADPAPARPAAVLAGDAADDPIYKNIP